ncbi:DoxX family protein [Streptomonospora sp. S1-112]|uniref:DoxX family protein n=1 Tax=Streptomonospora mangrovi TaxID=2883123 RepID=A0A9X3NI33_9ACTN|nr:DoxX family protein [Streptomonospora mangrovi]MDA0563837.1 DoxX family protein [Streptomonospora mangrovi]
MTTTLLRDLALLAGRVAVGVVFIAHGWQKLTESGPAGTAAGFAQMGVPLPTASAWFATFVELVGGAALVLGLATPVAGVLLALNMLGAFVLVHAGNGVFVAENGFELVLTLAAASLMLAAVGAGRFSLDRLVAPRLPGLARRETAGAAN